MAINRTEVRTHPKHAAVAVFRQEQDVVRAVRGLHELGFGREQISLLTKDRDSLSAAVRDNDVLDGVELDSPESIADEVKPKGHDEIWGMGIGGTVGLFIGLATIAIPGFGAFLLAAGPLAIAAQALTVSAAGIGLGALVGAINDERVTEEHRTFYTKAIEAGHWLIVAHADDKDDAERAADLLRAQTHERVEAY